MFGVEFDGSQVNVFVAFVGGFVTFFASCLLPLVPTYLAYLSGIATQDKKQKLQSSQKREILRNGILFTAGFILVFIILGATVNSIGRTLQLYRPVIQRVGGAFFIIMGLFMMDIISPMVLLKERRLTQNKHFSTYRYMNSFLVGMTFGFAWTPCIGPVLAVILFWASQLNTFGEGLGLLTAYGIGLGVPFILVAALYEQFAGTLMRTKKLGKVLNIAAAVIIIIVGVLLMLGKIEYVSYFLLRLFRLNTLAV